MMYIEPVALAAQSAGESLGSVVTGSALAGTSPALVDPLPMGVEEDTLAFAVAAAAHAGQFLGVGAAGALQRELFAATVGVDGIGYAVMDAANAVGLTA